VSSSVGVVLKPAGLEASKGRFNVYGYTVAQGLVHVLKQCGHDLARANIKQAASIKHLTLPMLLPGIKVNTGPNDFYPIEHEQLAKFDGERWVLFGEIFDAVRSSGATRGTSGRSAGWFPTPLLFERRDGLPRPTATDGQVVAGRGAFLPQPHGWTLKP
jgi:hypothetical protein